MKLFCRKDHSEDKEDEKEVAARHGRVKGIFEDLLSLEINVIVTPGMTARKMPDPPEAFKDVADAYTDLLANFSNEIRSDLARIDKTEERDPIRLGRPSDSTAWDVVPADLSMVDDKGNLQAVTAFALARPGPAPTLTAFRELEARARQAWTVACELMATPDWPRPAKEVNERVVLLKRVFGNCEQLIKIIDPEGGRPEVTVTKDRVLTAEQLITLRKIWEVGIATVVMQTVIQLDGDIVTRIHAGHARADDSILHQLHRESVGSAVEHWRFLGQTLAQFLQSALKRFL